MLLPYALSIIAQGGDDRLFDGRKEGFSMSYGLTGRVLLVFVAWCLMTSALFAVTSINVDEQELEREYRAQSWLLLVVTPEDLDRYEFLASHAHARRLVGRPSATLDGMLEDWERNYRRRIRFTVYSLALHRRELNAAVTHFESKPATSLVPQEGMLAVYLAELERRQRTEELAARVRALLAAARDEGNRRTFEEQVFMGLPDLDDAFVFAMQLRILTARVLDGEFDGVDERIAALRDVHGDDPGILALEANVAYGRARRISDQALQRRRIQEAFDLFRQAVDRGLKDPDAVPGLSGAYTKTLADEWAVLVRYWPFPGHLDRFRERALALCEQSKIAITYLPSLEHRQRAYRILSQLFTYWPSSGDSRYAATGPRPVEYGETVEFSRLVNRATPWPAGIGGR